MTAQRDTWASARAAARRARSARLTKIGRRRSATVSDRVRFGPAPPSPAPCARQLTTRLHGHDNEQGSVLLLTFIKTPDPWLQFSTLYFLCYQ